MTFEVRTADELVRLRGQVDRVLAALIWLHVPLIACVAWLQDNSIWVLGGCAGAVAAAVAVAQAAWPAETARRMMVAVGAMVMVSLLLAASAGSAWQADIHMCYFAALALLAVYCDRNVILVGTVVTAFHHLILSFVAPALVFSGPSDLGRVLLHAGILLVQAASLFWVTGYLAKLITTHDANLAKADAAREEVVAAVSAQEAALKQATEIRHKTMLDLSARFEASVGGIVDSVVFAATQLRATSETMAAAAAETTRQSTAVAEASGGATHSVQSVSAAAEQLAASIGEISQRIRHSSTMIKDSVRQARLSNTQVKGLTEAADRIGNVVNIISDIAGQTNLLALNATIEAARAGEAGKGFAVVASEVKALANQTAKATEEIATQIKAIQEATQSSAKSIQDIAETIGQVDESTSAIAAAVDQQGTATQEISRGVLQAVQGTQQVCDGIDGVNATAQQTGSAAADVLTSAGALSRNGDALKVQLQAFLQEVRSA
jgi:methyl-accepting chemotaxis protein